MAGDTRQETLPCHQAWGVTCSSRLPPTPTPMQADAQGCFSQVVRTKIFQLKRERYAMSLLLTGTVTEEGTGLAGGWRGGGCPRKGLGVALLS